MKNKVLLSVTILITMLVSAAFLPVNAKAWDVQSNGAEKSDTTPTNPAGKTLNVNGMGSVTLTPDIAHVNIGVHIEDADIVKAIDMSNQNTNKVKDILVKNGVADKDIQTSNFSVFTNRQFDNASGKPTTTTFGVDNTLNVTVRDLKQISKLIGEVTRNGANNIYGITFDVSDKAKALSDARKLAFDDAKSQATEMAGVLGVTLGEIKSASISSGSTAVPMDYGMGGSGGEAMKSNNVPISTGQLVLSVTLDLTYEIK
jgi:uncharacterized protein